MATGELLPMDDNARAALNAYERGRLRWAAWGFAPVLVLPALVLCIDGMSARTVALGTLLFTVGVYLLWKGQEPARGVLPGVVAGMIPLVAALCAPGLHLCTGETCMSLCLTACVTGGAVAGAAVGFVWRRSTRGRIALGVAAALSLITGALGCACVGYAGVLGMTAGLGLGLLPWSMLQRSESSS